MASRAVRIAVALILAACAAGLPTTAEAAPKETVWQGLQNRADDAKGRVDVKTALTGFAAAIGPVPGIKVPKGKLGDVDPTTALGWVMANYNRLPKKARKAVRRDIDLLVKLSKPLKSKRARASSASADAATVTAARTLFRGKLGLTGRGPSLAGAYFPNEIPRKYLGILTPKLVDAHAVTLWLPPNHPKANQCLIILLPAGRALAGQDRRYVLAHEAFHCAIFELLHGQSLHGWLNEGTPTWAGCEFAPGAAAAAGWYDVYAQTPDVGDGHGPPDLFSRAYSALGFFSLLEGSGIDVWSRMRAMLQAGNGGNDLPGYQAAVGGDEERVLDNWASSYFRMPARGGDWEFGGLCKPASHPEPHELTIANGTRAPIETKPFTAKLHTLDVAADADLVRVRVDHGNVRVNGGGVDDKHVGDAYYCTASDRCVCPPGKAYTGPKFTVMTDRAPLVALSGGQPGVAGTIEGLQKSCGQPPVPVPDPGPPTACPTLVAKQLCFVFDGEASATADTYYTHSTGTLTWHIVTVLTYPGTVFQGGGEFMGGYDQTLSSASGQVDSDPNPGRPGEPCHTPLTYRPDPANPLSLMTDDSGSDANGNWTVDVVLPFMLDFANGPCSYGSGTGYFALGLAFRNTDHAPFHFRTDVPSTTETYAPRTITSSDAYLQAATTWKGTITVVTGPS